MASRRRQLRHTSRQLFSEVPHDSRYISTSEFNLHTNLDYYSAIVRLTQRSPVPGKGTRFFSSQKCPDQFLDPASFLFDLYEGFFPPRAKRLRREANNSTPITSSTKVRNALSYPSAPAIRLHGV
jgi:hypothetical protein